MFLLEPSRTPYDLSWRMFGTSVRVHPVFWLISAILGWSSLDLGVEYLLVWIACVFVSILVHEMGHVLVGRAFGYNGHIILYGFGGLAVGSNAMPNRGQRILVALAGPFAGFALLLIVWLGVNVMWPWEATALTTVIEVRMGDSGGISKEVFIVLDEVHRILHHPTLPEEAFLNLFFINVFWGLINLLPIWPLDGGQVSRDLLGWLVPGKGLRLSLGLSLLLAAIIAINALLVTYEKPHIPFLGWLGGTYTAILFGLLAIQSYQMLMQVQNPPRPWRHDDTNPWESDSERWRA